MALTSKADEALILAAWGNSREAAAQALNLTEQQVSEINTMSEDELIAALLYKRNAAATA